MFAVSDKLPLFQIQLSELVGKNILLYFSAHWCPPCRAFLPKLIEAYQKIKAKDEALEVIFISSDQDQTAFDEFFSNMPWLALPFGDKRKASLNHKFRVRGIPSLIAIGPTGRTVTTEARKLIMAYGADAYPFTEEHIKKLEAQNDEMAKGWPKKLKHALHEEHELALTKRPHYVCDGCEKEGGVWSFHCDKCDFNLHPKCALEKVNGGGNEREEEGSGGEGWKCDGEVCRRV